ncbi:MAG: hypothetical protein R3B48_29645 [Kofleriaceae bacterium]
MKVSSVRSLEPDRIHQAYLRARDALAADPLFGADPQVGARGLAELEARMVRAPEDAAALGEWLEGGEELRYAGLAVLLEAYGRSAPPAELDGDLHLAIGDVLMVPGAANHATASNTRTLTPRDFMLGSLVRLQVGLLSGAQVVASARDAARCWTRGR